MLSRGAWWSCINCQNWEYVDLGYLWIGMREILAGNGSSRIASEHKVYKIRRCLRESLENGTESRIMKMDEKRLRSSLPDTKYIKVRLLFPVN